MIGDDIAGASLLGYEDGACETELTDVSATVTRREVSLLVQHGYFPETTDANYSDGRLDDVFDELFFQKQIFYLSCNVTVPAKSSFTVSASFTKEASFNYACGRHEDTQIYGYDAAFSLGSCLSFRVQNATIMGADKIELVEQNFRFDPGQGIKTVELDLSTDRYYLTVRPAS